jgi:hypothetical protein
VRRTVLIGLLVLLAAVPATAAARERPWRPHVRAAAHYAATRAGGISFSVRTSHRQWGMDTGRTVPSASVLKAMLLVAYLRRPEVRSRKLRRADMALLTPMVRWSDNTAATRVRNIVGDGGLMALAGRSGMRRFRPAAVWGLSRVDAADQTRFFLHIDSYVPRRHRRAAMGLLRTIVPSQRWGVGRVRPRGWALYFKGGWGSGTGAVDHQVALLRRGRRRVAVAVMTTSSPSHAYGCETLRGVFARLLRGLRPGIRVARVAPVPWGP